MIGTRPTQPAYERARRRVHRPRPVTTPPRQPRRPAAQHDRGSVSAQVIVVWPVLFTVLLLIIQAVIWAYANYAAQAAAERGLDAARTLGGSSGAGDTETRQVLDQLDAGPLTDPQVSVNLDAATATVRIDGHAQQLLPWLHLPVHAEATGPRETSGTP